MAVPIAKYAWKSLVIFILLSITASLGATVIFYGTDIFDGIFSLFDYAFMVGASFDWLISFTAFRVVFWTILAVEGSMLVIKLVFGFLYVSKD